METASCNIDVLNASINTIQLEDNQYGLTSPFSGRLSRYPSAHVRIHDHMSETDIPLTGHPDVETHVDTWDTVATAYTGSDYVLLKDQATFTVPAASDSESTVLVYVDPPAGGTVLSTTTETVNGVEGFSVTVTSPEIFRFSDFSGVTGYELSGVRGALDQVEDIADVNMPMGDAMIEYLLGTGKFDYGKWGYLGVMSNNEGEYHNTNHLIVDISTDEIGGWNGESTTGNWGLIPFSVDTAVESVSLKRHETNGYPAFGMHTLVTQTDFAGTDVVTRPLGYRKSTNSVGDFRGQFDKIHNMIPIELTFDMAPHMNYEDELNYHRMVVTEDTWIMSLEVIQFASTDPNGAISVLGYPYKGSELLQCMLISDNPDYNMFNTMFFPAGEHIVLKNEGLSFASATIRAYTHAPTVVA